MLLSEREKLFSCTDTFIGIGISKNGEKYVTLPVPWEKTVHAFNMKTPDIYLEPSDLKDEEIMAQIAKNKVIGCYIFEELADYSFLEKLTEIRDLYIRKGKNIKDLSFMSNMKEWFMLLLEDAELENLDDIYPPKGVKPPQYSYCMAFYHCDVKDVSAIKDKNLYLSELIVWNKKDEAEYAKWKSVARGMYRYYNDEE